MTGVPNLWAVKIDPKAVGEIYKTRILDDARQRGRPEVAIKAMAEELDSPCTEEIAAFDRFIDFASDAQWQTRRLRHRAHRTHAAHVELPHGLEQADRRKVFARWTREADDVAKQRFAGCDRHDAQPARSTFAFVM